VSRRLLRPQKAAASKPALVLEHGANNEDRDDQANANESDSDMSRGEMCSENAKLGF
jgi:hypothetical protein